MKEGHSLICKVRNNRATNASAESLNSKIKGFKAQLYGVADMPFFLYRVCTTLGLVAP